MAIGAGKRVVIVGAGLAGSLMACSLAALGYEVLVYERRADPRAKGYEGGRSINLALSTPQIDALTRVGLAEKVLADAIPMKGRAVHPTVGSWAFQAYSSNPADHINSVSRGGLNLTLLEAAAANPNVKLFFNHRCIDVDIDAPAAIFEDPADASKTIRVQGDFILGADGAFSPIRGRLQKIDRFDCSQTYLAHGYKELHIPPTAEGKFAMEENALHIWPRGGSMMIALPNKDKSFTCTLFWPFDGDHSFANLRTADDVLAFFKKQYPDAVPLMPTLAEDYFKNPTGSLVTVRCSPWSYAGKVVILGDAAHAIVPFYGQGMNCAFEDCVAFIEMLTRAGGDTVRAFAEFERIRKEHADAIADMALDNFIEMRDKVGHPLFRYKKKLEHALHGYFPRLFVPLYNMVSFTTIPYAEAKRRGRRQGLILRGILGAALMIVLFVLIHVLLAPVLISLSLAGVIAWFVADRVLSSLEPRFNG